MLTHLIDLCLRNRMLVLVLVTLMAAGGVIKSDAARELRRFATTYNIPVVTTLHGLGAFDTTHPLSLHMLGMHGTAFANYAVEDCDFLIALAITLGIRALLPAPALLVVDSDRLDSHHSAALENRGEQA